MAYKAHGMGVGLLVLGLLVALSACAIGQPSPPATIGQPSTARLILYSGRNERLIGPLLEQFARETGTDVQVRYGDTAELAAALLEEGDSSPADLFLAQDAGGLGAVAQAGRFRALPASVLNAVDERFRAPDGSWVGLSGRARVVVYNTNLLTEAQLPDTIHGFTDPKWRGKLGWAPTNGSFQAFVTALRLAEGDAAAKAWLEGIKRNQPKVYPNNIAIVDAVGKGEIVAGFVNHYYLYTLLRERGESFPARNYHPRAGDAGAMVNVAGIGILKTTRQAPAAERFVAFLLGKQAQQYFAAQTFEYPLAKGVAALPGLLPLEAIKAPRIDLGNLSDLQGTLRLLQDVGVL